MCDVRVGEVNIATKLPQPTQQHASALCHREPPAREGSVRPRTGRRSARPPSARPAPPRVRERREVPKEEIQRPGTAKPVANVILPTETIDADDDDNFVVEESKPAVAVEDDTVSQGHGSGIMGHGSMVMDHWSRVMGQGSWVTFVLEVKIWFIPSLLT